MSHLTLPWGKNVQMSVSGFPDKVCAWTNMVFVREKTTWQPYNKPTPENKSSMRQQLTGASSLNHRFIIVKPDFLAAVPMCALCKNVLDIISFKTKKWTCVNSSVIRSALNTPTTLHTDVLMQLLVLAVTCNGKNVDGWELRVTWAIRNLQTRTMMFLFGLILLSNTVAPFLVLFIFLHRLLSCTAELSPRFITHITPNRKGGEKREMKEKRPEPVYAADVLSVVWAFGK